MFMHVLLKCSFYIRAAQPALYCSVPFYFASTLTHFHSTDALFQL